MYVQYLAQCFFCFSFNIKPNTISTHYNFQRITIYHDMTYCAHRLFILSRRCSQEGVFLNPNHKVLKTPYYQLLYSFVMLSNLNFYLWFFMIIFYQLYLLHLYCFVVYIKIAYNIYSFGCTIHIKQYYSIVNSSVKFVSKENKNNKARKDT